MKVILSPKIAQQPDLAQVLVAPLDQLVDSVINILTRPNLKHKRRSIKPHHVKSLPDEDSQALLKDKDELLNDPNLSPDVKMELKRKLQDPAIANI